MSASRLVVQHMATYGPRRLAAFHALWKAVSQNRKPGAPGLGDRLRALPRMISAGISGRYPEFGRGRVALFVLALIYLVSPIDFVPEAFLGLLGLGDDAVVALWLSGAFLVDTDKYLEWERNRPTVIDQPPHP